MLLRPSSRIEYDIACKAGVEIGGSAPPLPKYHPVQSILFSGYEQRLRQLDCVLRKEIAIKLILLRNILETRPKAPPFVSQLGKQQAGDHALPPVSIEPCPILFAYHSNGR